MSGGTSSFDGLAQRLDSEIELLAPHLGRAKAKGKDMVTVKSGKKWYFVTVESRFKKDFGSNQNLS